jgi:hypothetical protein
MHVSGRRAVGLCVVAVAVAVGACSVIGSPTPTLHDEEGMPLWASVSVIAEPAVADRPIELAILTLPDAMTLRRTTIPPGTVVRWEEGLSADLYRLVALGGACALDLELPPEQDTDVILRLDVDPCRFDVLQGDIVVASGSVAATVTLRPWDGLLVEAVPLDEPRQPVPGPVAPDEGGLAQLSPLYLGRYEIRLRRGDTVLETQEIAIEDRGEAGHLVSLRLDGVED